MCGFTSMVWNHLHYPLSPYQLFSPTDIQPLGNHLPLQQPSMECIHPAIFTFLCHIRMDSRQWYDITNVIHCLHISSFLHQIFNHRQVTFLCSMHQWVGFILIAFTDTRVRVRSLFDRITITYLTSSFSFTSLPCSSIRERPAAKSPRSAASHTYTCMNTFITACAGASYRIGHDDFHELCFTEQNK